MRTIAVIAVLALAAATPATPAVAGVAIEVDLKAQEMTVTVDGRVVHEWPVSTGRRGHSTPPGRFTVQSMDADHYSSLYDDAPMPHSIFYDGHRAIHGTRAEGRLGRPASHGCIRLSRANAKTLFALVRGRRGDTTIRVR